MMGRIEAFVCVAEERSFRAAARRLGISAAAVSKSVARLEADLGARLLHRTSRRVSLTEEGAAYLGHCQAALQQLRIGRDRVQQVHAATSGTLRVSLSPALGPTLVARLPELAARHPDLVLQLSFSDQLARLFDEDVDVAVRIGALSDSTLVARRLGVVQLRLVASPAYLARHPAPASIAALARHRCLKFQLPGGEVADWVLGGQARALPAAATLDNGSLLVQAARAGLGVCQALDLMVREDIKDGRLVELLPEAVPPAAPLSALCRPARRKAASVRVLLDFLAEVFS